MAPIYTFYIQAECLSRPINKIMYDISLQSFCPHISFNIVRFCKKCQISANN